MAWSDDAVLKILEDEVTQARLNTVGDGLMPPKPLPYAEIAVRVDRRPSRVLKSLQRLQRQDKAYEVKGGWMAGRRPGQYA
jgi:hypothetical protein